MDQQDNIGHEIRQALCNTGEKMIVEVPVTFFGVGLPFYLATKTYPNKLNGRKGSENFS